VLKYLKDCPMRRNNSLQLLEGIALLFGIQAKVL
jgi:hypothetical protein